MTLADVRTRLHTIEGTRTALLEEMARLDTSSLTRRPPDGGWSILEILEHLVLAERDVFGDLEAAAPPPGGVRTVKSRLLFGVVVALLRLRIPVKVPSRGMIPAGQWSLDEVRARWDASQAALRTFVGGLTEEDLGRAIFRHPVSGPLSVGEAVLLLEVHLHRHIGQIRGRLSEGR